MKFREWFLEQFGDRPYEGETADLRRKVAEAKAQLANAERQLADTLLYDEQWRAALYAWKAKDSS